MDPNRKYQVFSLLSTPVLAVLFFFGFSHSESAQREANVLFVHCLILGALPPVLIIPATITRLTRGRFFYPCFAIWCAVAIPALFFWFTWAAGFGHRCDHLFFLGSLFAVVMISRRWWLERKGRRAGAKGSPMSVKWPGASRSPAGGTSNEALGGTGGLRRPGGAAPEGLAEPRP